MASERVNPPAMTVANGIAASSQGHGSRYQGRVGGSVRDKLAAGAEIDRVASLSLVMIHLFNAETKIRIFRAPLSPHAPNADPSQPLESRIRCGATQPWRHVPALANGS